MIAPRFPRLLRNESGVSAVEFALVAPIFCFILVAVLEFGNILFQRFELDGALSAGANYALVNGDRVSRDEAAGLADSIAKVVNARGGTGWAGVDVVVNNASSVSIAPGAVSPTTGGTPDNADNCYCPSGDARTLTWGSGVACTATCPSGPVGPGKYVRIALSMPYTPILSGYGIVEAGTIEVATLIRTE